MQVERRDAERRALQQVGHAEGEAPGEVGGGGQPERREGVGEGEGRRLQRNLTARGARPPERAGDEERGFHDLVHRFGDGELRAGELGGERAVAPEGELPAAVDPHDAEVVDGRGNQPGDGLGHLHLAGAGAHIDGRRLLPVLRRRTPLEVVARLDPVGVDRPGELRRGAQVVARSAGAHFRFFGRRRARDRGQREEHRGEQRGGDRDQPSGLAAAHAWLPSSHRVRWALRGRPRGTARTCAISPL